MVRYCLDCGETVDSDDQYCYYCGERLPATEPEGERNDRSEGDEGQEQNKVVESETRASNREPGPDRYCLDCGEPAREGDRYCYFCGEPIPPSESDERTATERSTAEYCPDCGTTVEPDDTFCYYCGERL